MVHELDWPYSDLRNIVVGDNGISGSRIDWSPSFLKTLIYFKVRYAASESSSVVNVITKTSGKGIGSFSVSNGGIQEEVYGVFDNTADLVSSHDESHKSIGVR